MGRTRQAPPSLGETSHQDEELGAFQQLQAAATGYESPNSSPSSFSSGSEIEIDEEAKNEIERQVASLREARMGAIKQKKMMERKQEAKLAQKKADEEQKKKREEAEEREKAKKAEEEERARIAEDDFENDLEDDLTRELRMQSDENELIRKKEMRDQAKEYDRKQKRIARDQHSHAQDADYVATDNDEDASEEEHVSPLTRKAATKKSAQKAGKEKVVEEIEDYFSFFKENKFVSTVYPDLKTAEKLGIKEDVEALFEGCGLKHYMTKALPVYPTAAAEFLATVKVTVVRDSTYLLDLLGGGYITFLFRGKESTVTFKQIQEYFDFPTGLPYPFKIDEKEINDTWKLLTGEDVFSNNHKSAEIRSPVVTYVRRAIAETFYSRDMTGQCSTRDMKLLTIGLGGVFGTNPLTNKTIIGDTAYGGLAYALCKQFESYRGKASGKFRQGQRVAPLNIGGPITGILKIDNVPLNWDEEEHYSPKFMDVEYLRRQQLFTGPIKHPKFYYKFPHPDNPKGVIALPNRSITSFENRLNVMFIPSEDLLIEAETLEPTKTTPTTERTGPSGSMKKKKGTSLTEKVIEGVPCLCTREGLKEELRKEIEDEVEERLWKKMKNELKEHLHDMEKFFVKKPTLVPKATLSSQDTKETSSLPATIAPTAPTLMKRPPHATQRSDGSRASDHPKVPRSRSPPKEDAGMGPLKKKIILKYIPKSTSNPNSKK